MNVFANPFTDLTNLASVNVAPDESQNVVVKGDVLFTVSSETPAEVGMSSVVLDTVPNCYLNSFCALFRFKNGKHPNLRFLGYSLRQPKVRYHFSKRAQGSTRFNLSKSVFQTLPLALPSPAEQQRIADCLTSLDEVIAAQRRKVEALKVYKRGLMQLLFPRVGESAPRRRFPEFTADSVWAPKALGQAATFHNGRSYAKEELLQRGKYTVLRVGNFFTSDHWYYSDLELEDTKYCDKGDLLYAWSASFGPRLWQGDKTIYHYHIWKVVPKEEVNRTFLFYCLESETERMRTRSANGIGMFHITKAVIEGWISFFPSEKEQGCVAASLSAIDALIVAESEKEVRLNTHRKGLMQQLFPR